MFLWTHTEILKIIPELSLLPVLIRSIDIYCLFFSDKWGSATNVLCVQEWQHAAQCFQPEH